VNPTLSASAMVARKMEKRSFPWVSHISSYSHSRAFLVGPTCCKLTRCSSMPIGMGSMCSAACPTAVSTTIYGRLTGRGENSATSALDA
jgi:predicted permease